MLHCTVAEWEVAGPQGRTRSRAHCHGRREKCSLFQDLESWLHTTVHNRCFPAYRQGRLRSRWLYVIEKKLVSQLSKRRGDFWSSRSFGIHRYSLRKRRLNTIIFAETLIVGSGLRYGERFWIWDFLGGLEGRKDEYLATTAGIFFRDS